MSGPDASRGTDGGEHPLDVDARFADIVAHFHDGEPAPPRVVDDRGDGAGRTGEGRTGEGRTGEGRTGERSDGTAEDADSSRGDGTDAGAPGPGRSSGTSLHRAEDAARGRAARVPEHGEDAATDWALRYEQAAREELAAHEERQARREREARAEAEVDAAVDRETHRFVPEEPPPFPRPDLPGRLAWGAVLLGPLALILFAVLWDEAPSWLVGSVVVAIVAGFGYLVWRLPRTRDREDGGDGAIV
ncbi:hypothetical protein [Aquipuribacter hungaricus]|uniref:DUF308 domain-containing protein n=1 Tax=Aquipuribacter hungaricus TaxID=545624 RepID=A0ABV7WG20_9MICO